MRADRLISLLLLLQTHRRLTAREMAQRLEVSERTIHRDMLALTTAGVPVAAERGAGGGWFLMESYQTRLTGLNLSEIQALFLDKPAHVLEALGLSRASEAAAIKLLAALPSLTRGDAERARQRILVDAPGWQKFEEEVPCLPLLHRAICQGTGIRFFYQGGDGAARERRATPLGLIVKGKVWYLAAIVEGEVRAYRVSRIRDAAPMDEPYVRPPGFDLASWWERSQREFVGRLPRYLVRLRALPEAIDTLRAAKYVRIERETEPDADGWATLSLDFEIESEALAQSLRLGALIEVLEPEDLRCRVIAALSAALSRYAASDP